MCIRDRPNSVLNFCEVGPLLPYLFIERKTHFLHMELSVRCQATYMALQIALCALVSCYWQTGVILHCLFCTCTSLHKHQRGAHILEAITVETAFAKLGKPSCSDMFRQDWLQHSSVLDKRQWAVLLMLTERDIGNFRGSFNGSVSLCAMTGHKT